MTLKPLSHQGGVLTVIPRRPKNAERRDARSKRSVTPSGVSTALARCSLIFRSIARAKEIPDVFLEKAPVTASSQRPRRCYGALVTFYCVPTKFLLAILSALMARTVCTALSRHSNCAFTAFALRFHGFCTALTA